MTPQNTHSSLQGRSPPPFLYSGRRLDLESLWESLFSAFTSPEGYRSDVNILTACGWPCFYLSEPNKTLFVSKGKVLQIQW